MTIPKLIQLVLFYAAVAVCLPAHAVFTKPWNVAASDSKATAVDTRQVWRRCSVGQVFAGGTCTGTATLLTHEEALKVAQAERGWRLPTERELIRIGERTERNPAINFKVFPNTPSGVYWSSTPDVRKTGFARGVDFSNGGISIRSRGERGYVRLVQVELGATNLPANDFSKPF